MFMHSSFLCCWHLFPNIDDSSFCSVFDFDWPEEKYCTTIYVIGFDRCAAGAFNIAVDKCSFRDSIVLLRVVNSALLHWPHIILSNCWHKFHEGKIFWVVWTALFYNPCFDDNTLLYSSQARSLWLDLMIAKNPSNHQSMAKDCVNSSVLTTMTWKFT